MVSLVVLKPSGILLVRVDMANQKVTEKHMRVKFVAVGLKCHRPPGADMEGLYGASAI